MISDLVLDLSADFLQRLLLGFGERQFGGNGVTFSHERAALLLGQHQRPRPLQFLREEKKILISNFKVTVNKRDCKHLMMSVHTYTVS